MKRRELQKVIESDEQINAALAWTEAMIRRSLPGGEVAVFVGRPRRTLDQNAKLWPMLTDISRQVEWHGQKLTKEEWKDVLTAGLKQQRAVPAIDGGFVVLGAHTSKMSKRDLSQLIELAYAFGTQHDVEWSEPAKEAYEEHKAA